MAMGLQRISMDKSQPAPVAKEQGHNTPRIWTESSKRVSFFRKTAREEPDSGAQTWSRASASAVASEATAKTEETEKRSEGEKLNGQHRAVPELSKCLLPGAAF